MILLSLASKQIWPQVLAVTHLKPDRLLLLHSDDPVESRGPAQRLKRLFDKHELVPRGNTRLGSVPHDNFSAIEQRLDELATTHGLDLRDCTLHFTGGNKLMATAAFRWATNRGLKCFYLERGRQLTWFDPTKGDLYTRTETLDGHLTDFLDPADLLHCQLDASEIEHPGQCLRLSKAGRELAETEFLRRVANGNDPRPWLDIEGVADRAAKEGDLLEFATAAVLLKLGVPRVQRGLRLKVKSGHHVGTRLPHAEIDLLFNWNGHLWLVDCKDRKPAKNLVAGLRRLLPYSLPSAANDLLERIREELAISQTKALKEDLLAVREAGGLLGQIICVRKAELPDEVRQFARHYNISLVMKNELVDQLRTLLSPTRPATQDQLRSLEAAFRPKR